jgi:MFS family permease
MERIKSKNILLMYVMDFWGGCLFFLPVLALYFEKSLYSAKNIAIIFAIEAISVAIFDIPTGVLSDKLGRKNISIAAYGTLLLSVIVLLLAGNNMVMFIIYAALSGLSMALGSGNGQSLIYDTLKEENKENLYKKIIGISNSMWPLGASLSSILGGYLASKSLTTAIYFTLIPVGIAFILTFFLKEPKYKKSETSSFIHAKDAFKEIFRNKQLIILFIGGFLLMSIGESLHNFNSIFLNFKNLPIIYFGYFGAAMFGLSALGHYIGHDVSEKFGNKSTLILAVTFSPIIGLASTLTHTYFSAILLSIPSIFFGIKNVVSDYLFNKNVLSSHRATINSILNSSNRIGIAVVVVFFGYLADLYSINTAFTIGFVLLLFVPILYLFVKDN